MSAVLYSEGPLDIGECDPFAPTGQASPVGTLIKSILENPDGLVIEGRPLSTKKHGNWGRQEDKGHGKGFARKAYLVLRDATREQNDAVFIVVDRDGDQKRLVALHKGREAAATTIPSAIGVAQEMVESWLLGDAGAWRCFGDVVPDLPTDPETQTAGRGSQRYAKQVLRDHMAAVLGHTQRSWLERYDQLARHIDWRTPQRRCPRSFAPFAAEVRSHVGPLFGLRD